MKFNVSDAENSQKMIEVEIPYLEFSQVFEKQLNKILPTIKMQGFRPGKAPKDRVLKEYKHRINAQALEELINTTVERVIREAQIVPINVPAVKDVVFEEDKPITFKVYVDVFPAVNLTNYKDFEFEREIRIITDEDVEEVLEKMREDNVIYDVADEDAVVESGNKVVIDFEGKIDGVPFENGSAKDYPLDIGSHTFIEGFEEGLIGMKKGETKELSVRFPDNYNVPDLAGKDVVFTVTVKEIKVRKLPELNDEFATTVNPDVDSLEKLKEKIKKELISDAEIFNKEAFYDKLLKKFIEENPFDLPVSIIDEQSKNLAERAIRNYCRSYGLDYNKMGIGVDKIKEHYKKDAIAQTKAAIILNAIAEKENITVTDEDVEAKMAEYAAALNMPVEEYKETVNKNGTINNIKNNILMDKVYDFLCSVNKVIDKTVTLKDIREKELQEDESDEGDEKAEKAE
jgi:trigger factor